MKTYQIILPAVASVMLLTGCEEQIMEWGTPDDHNQVTVAEIPLEVKEVIANYDNIKAYAAQYTPGMTVGCGIGADLYLGNEAYKQTVDDNFQVLTLGNAMKHDAVVKSNGSLDFTKIDQFLDTKGAGMELYGHTFFWYQQTQQAYLKSLISPEVVIQTDASGSVENLITNSDFEAGNTSGWGAWSSAGCTQSISEAGEGYESTYAIKLYNPEAGANYSAQAYYTLPDVAYEVGETYILSYYVMADHVDPQFQMQLQNRNTYSAQKYLGFPISVAGQWLYCETEFEMTQDIIDSGFNHLTVDFGAQTGYVYLDNVQFGKKKAGPTNYVSNGSFENGLEDWNIINGKDNVSVVELSDAVDGTHALSMQAVESMVNHYDLQIECAKMPTLPGKMVQLSFWVKSDQTGAGTVYFSDDMSNKWPWLPWYPGASSWTASFETGTSWKQVSVVLQKYSVDFNDGATTWNFNLNFGSIPGVTYYIDDVQVIEYEEEAASANAPRLASRAASRATTISYVFKTPEEKRELLLGAMESWVKDMAEHLKEKGVTPVGYDVINEPITDGDSKIRGVDGVFGGYDTDADSGVATYDAEPVEDEENGLTLNWGSSRFYWGYYVKDYGVKAFQYARQYLPAETKLFVNDYNLETSPAKLAALVDFVKGIDAANGSAIVDGIGTQMHVTISTSDDTAKNAEAIAELKAKVDAMFQTMAATGKLVRVTELDIALGTSSPSAAQYQAQADAYQTIIESYKANVPAAQQSGITIWGLSDNADEHEYWLNGEVPNIFDADYKRKWAYKGVCDGLAGEDLGLKYGGEDYKAYYEKNNTSDTVK